jgi:cytochrome P450
VVTRYADVAALVGDDRLGAEFDKEYHRIALGGGPLADFFGHVMLNRDPPVHTVLRRLLGRSSPPGRCASAARRIDSIVKELCTGPRRGPDGRVTRLGTSCRSGCWRTSWDGLGQKIDEVAARARILSQAFATYLPRRRRAETVDGMEWMQDLVETMFDEKRPRARRRRRFSAVRDRRGRPPAGSARSTSRVPAVRRVLHDDRSAVERPGRARGSPGPAGDPARFPELIPNAVEELLRFDAPVQVKSRVVHQPVEIGGAGSGRDAFSSWHWVRRTTTKIALHDRASWM